MKQSAQLTVATIALLCTSSCGIFQDKNLAKRYSNHYNANTFGNVEFPEKFVKVEMNSTLLVESKEKDIKYNLLSLSDKGQEAFINSANTKSASAAELMNMLNTNLAFSQPEKARVKIIPKTVRRP
ncbi:hypothetical protein CLU96_2490 [Chryseobacterium sp. 52]|uniref:hypothetical protein n=1 Tax=Chryseobacterium sp. 52 TaxID=2035213 RepID=UPI000C1A4340|nr:hypothetical protein [Chryseobacterium sp. 52]PIF45484.1 hypothetical protein CLU96_2490 [Chryseobacterium sp. 52]